jgi:hypothetical protein
MFESVIAVKPTVFMASDGMWIAVSHDCIMSKAFYTWREAIDFALIRSQRVGHQANSCESAQVIQ